MVPVWCAPSKKANSNFNPATALLMSQTRAVDNDQTMRCMNALTKGSMGFKQKMPDLVQGYPSKSGTSILPFYLASRISGVPPLEGITMIFELADLASSFMA